METIILEIQALIDFEKNTSLEIKPVVKTDDFVEIEEVCNLVSACTCLQGCGGNFSTNGSCPCLSSCGSNMNH